MKLVMTDNSGRHVINTYEVTLQIVTSTGEEYPPHFEIVHPQSNHGKMKCIATSAELRLLSMLFQQYLSR